MTAVTNTPKNKPALIEFRRGCYPQAMAFSGVARNASKEGGGLALIDATMPELNTLTLGNKTITEYNGIEFNKLLVYGVKPSDAEIAQMLKML